MSPLVILHCVHFVQQLINFPLMSPHVSRLLQTPPAPLLRRFLHTAAPCHHEPTQLQTMLPMWDRIAASAGLGVPHTKGLLLHFTYGTLCFMIASFSYFSAISKYYLCFVIYSFHICKQCCNLCCHTILWVADVQKYTAAIFKVPRVMVHIHCVTSGGPVRRLWNFSSFTLWYVLLAVICSGTLFVEHILTLCSG